MNIIERIINDNNTITFILKTSDEPYFWWWEVPRYDWEHYQHMNPSATVHDFVNDEDYATDCGFSCAGFDTIADAIADYNAEMQATEDEPEDDGELYRIHFTDNYGMGAIECHGTAEYNRCIQNLKDDPEVEDIWTESYDPEEGWQA